MALSKNGKFSKNDYFRQAEEVEESINNLPEKPQRVLEIGCGRGFNIAYLASRFPDIEFIGVDINDINIQSAKNRVSTLNNASIVNDDFHGLESFEDTTFGLVFAVESLCHANSMNSALRSIGRVLTAGGKLVVFDAFRDATVAGDALAQKAVVYTERAMAVPEFRKIDSFVNSAQRAGLSLDYTQDRSAEIMPNLIRLSDLAKAFFKSPVIAKIILGTLPRGLVTNAVAGLLMAVTVQLGVHQYGKLVFSKA